MVKAILKLLAKSKPVNDKIKVYRGEYLPGKNPSEGFKQKGEYFDNIKEKLKDIDLTPEKYANKLNKSEGRYFSTKKDTAKIFSKGEKGRVVEAEISKKDLELGRKMKKRFFKFDDEGTDDSNLLLPKKNLKDVKENIDSLYEKLGTAGMEYKSGGLVKKGFPKLTRKGWK
jgi:predicted ATP-dependent endonuclease of OLD family